MLGPMEYAVSIDLKLPTGTPHLDPLQAEGAGSVLDRLLDQVEGADVADPDDLLDEDDDEDEDEDSDGDVIVDRYWVGAHPEGAIVLLVLDADSLEIAEAAARNIITAVLDHSEFLTDWE